MAGSQLLDIVLIGSVAAFVLFRLYVVLGRRTGHERSRDDFRLQPSTEEAGPARPVAHAVPERPLDPVAAGLMDIAGADRSFDQEGFLKGARAAYEMILTAFASGDRLTLKPLLATDVYAAFDAAITAREQAGEKATITVVDFHEIKITAASLRDHVAEITVGFAARLISVTTDGAGKTVAGDPASVQEVLDLWSFSRDVRQKDPNWLLIATSSEPR